MNIFTEYVEKYACRICFTIDNVEDTFQCSYNDETMFDIINIVLKLPQASSNYLDKLCKNCLKAVINVHLFVHKLNDRKIFWEKALSNPRTKCSQTIDLPTDNDESCILYDQKLLRIDGVNIKNEEHIEYELIIKNEPHCRNDTDEQNMADDSDVHNCNDDYSNLDDGDDLPLMAITTKRVDDYTGVNRVPKYQDDSEPITKRAKCDARKEAATPKYVEDISIAEADSESVTIRTERNSKKEAITPKYVEDISITECDSEPVTRRTERNSEKEATTPKYEEDISMTEGDIEPVTRRTERNSGKEATTPEYEDVSISEGDSESVANRTECDAEKEAITPTQSRNSNKSVLCTECGKMYAKGRIKWHKLLHKNPEAFQCDMCDYVGSTLSTHLKRYHTKLDEPLSCQRCDSIHHNLHDFKEHLKIHDQKFRVQALNNMATNACHKCGKTYFFADTLAKHILSHDENRDSWCKHCQKGFTSNDHYKRHMRLHTGEKPFACPYCPKRYTQRWNYKNHVKMHDNKREYRCEFCEKTFNVKQSLVDHRRLHTGEKHNCRFCDRQFLQAANMYGHIRKFHPERVVSRPKVDAKAKVVMIDEENADAFKEDLSAKNFQN